MTGPHANGVQISRLAMLRTSHSRNWPRRADDDREHHTEGVGPRPGLSKGPKADGVGVKWRLPSVNDNMCLAFEQRDL